MAFIHLHNMEFYAYHGHFKEEQEVGNYFIVNVSIETDISKAAQSDKLEDALDYQKVYKLIDEEMKIKSYLIEPLLMRIVQRLFNDFPSIEFLSLSIAKVNPPLGGKVNRVSLQWQGKRNQL